MLTTGQPNTRFAHIPQGKVYVAKVTVLLVGLAAQVAALAYVGDLLWVAAAEHLAIHPLISVLPIAAFALVVVIGFNLRFWSGFFAR